MNEQEKQYIADVAHFLWNDRLSPKQVTPAVANVVSSAFHSAAQKSKVLNYVPRPTGTQPGVGWLISQAVQAFFRSRSSKIYMIARRAAALQWRSQYEMAKLGI